MVIELAVCLPCKVELHEECLAPSQLVSGRWTCCCGDQADKPDEVFGTEVGRPVSKPGDIDDVLSTGRKRAAMLYPIFEGMVCEWAGLAAAGGGIKPIVGCRGNVLVEERGKYSRHHGPDKNVLENGPHNVHRICPTCHNRWHALNNEFYGTRPEHGQPFLPVGAEVLAHDPNTKATDEEIEANEKWWATRKTDRALDED